jgi:Zn-finger protein
MTDEKTTKNHLETWAETHLIDIVKELKIAGIELKVGNIHSIIKETSFAVRSQKYPDKCPYYQENPPKHCHPELRDLNCLLCACPDYENTKTKGGCKLDLPLGKWYYHQALAKKKIWDCTDCPIPHIPKYVEDYLRKNISQLKRFEKD